MTDAPSLTSAGFAALARGDPRAARELFARAISSGATGAAAWYGESVAHRAFNATAEEAHALEQALKMDANFLPALIAKGDLCARQGDQRAASAHYAAATKLANSLPTLPPDWRNEMRRVEAAAHRIAQNFEKHLLSVLHSAHGFEPGSDRFSRGVDLLLGKRQVYLQQPTNFYYPELPQIEFYDPMDFAWVAALEAQTPRIRNEVRTLLDADTGWVPYIESETRRPNANANPLLEDPNWSAFYLIKNGAQVADNALRCPDTMAALREVPLCRIPGRTPSVLFSLLRPGTRIRPHHGYTNARLICHLPLIIPSECGLRVGNETRAWREGEVVVFDDSVEHEAWNLSKETRVVMIFDVWRPELSDKERGLVATTLESVDRFDASNQNVFNIK